MFLKKTKSILSVVWAKLNNPSPAEVALNHEDVIVSMAKIFKPKVYVELGLYECRLFNKMIPLVSEKLIGVDVSLKAGEYMDKNSKSEFKCMTTDKFAEELMERKLVIDMMFIDADHSEKSVLKDFENYFPYVKEDGLIFLHDGYPKNQEYTQSGYCGDGYKAIFALSKQTENHEMVTLPLAPGLTICRKRTKQMKWLNNN